MGFMQKQAYTGIYYAIETADGTTFLPADVCGTLSGIDPGILYEKPDASCDDDTHEVWRDWCRSVSDYVPGKDSIQSISENSGTLYRLSAPGYMDCTEWTTDGDSPEFDDDDDEPEECPECHGMGDIDYTDDHGVVTYEGCDECGGTGERS